MIDDWVAKLWSRFFCLSVYITMYLNDHQRSAFYESLGLNTTQFNQHGEQRGWGMGSGGLTGWVLGAAGNGGGLALMPNGEG